jgi:tetratricopeptide (TPR) repeat protein
MSLEDLGRILHRDRSYLAKIERGERTASPEIALECDRALGDDGTLVRLHRMVMAADARPHDAVSTDVVTQGDQAAHVVAPGLDVAKSGLHVAKTPSLLVPGDVSPARLGEGEVVSVPARMPDGRVVFVSVSRRVFLGAVGASAVGVAAARSLPGVGSGRVVSDVHPVEHFERMRQVIVDSDNLFGPEQVIPTVTGQIELIRQLRQGVRSGGDQSALLAMQTKYAELAGWLYQDYGDFESAEYWTNRALEWSHGARDHDLMVFVLARRAQLAGDRGDARQALDLGVAAREMALAGSRLEAVAATHMAHGYALEGDLDGTRRGYDEARELLETMQVDPDSPWGVWLDVPYVEVARHRSLALLGEYAQAAEGFEAAIAALPADFRRDRGVYLARAARAYAGAGDVEHAAGLGLQALAVGVETRSGRILTELALLGDAFVGVRSAGVVEFLEATADTISHHKT